MHRLYSNYSTKKINSNLEMVSQKKEFTSKNGSCIRMVPTKERMWKDGVGVVLWEVISDKTRVVTL